MKIRLHPHAESRLEERGATRAEVIATVETGEVFPVKYGRVGFRKNFQYVKLWRNKFYTTKQVEAYAVKEGKDWLVITFVTRYF